MMIALVLSLLVTLAALLVAWRALHLPVAPVVANEAASRFLPAESGHHPFKQLRLRNAAGAEVAEINTHTCAEWPALVRRDEIEYARRADGDYWERES